MEELVNKINELLDKLNESFVVDAKISDSDNTVEEFKITGLKNDGSEFIEEMINMFSQIIMANDEYEFIYDPNEGIKIAKKVTKVEYVYDEKK